MSRATELASRLTHAAAWLRDHPDADATSVYAWLSEDPEVMLDAAELRRVGVPTAAPWRPSHDGGATRVLSLPLDGLRLVAVERRTAAELDAALALGAL